MRDLFINTLMSPNVHREGMENLIDYLTNDTDFFSAPASTRFHGADPGGLLEHSIAVARRMVVFAETCSADLANSTGSPAIVSLLHDVCKANFYKTVLKWRKDENNK